MQLTLRYQESAQRPGCAAFLRGTDPAAWLREIGRWGLAAGQLSCYLVPESIRSVRPAGLFVVAKEGALPPDVQEPYGVVAGRLYVPVQAALWPATTPEELGAVLLWPRQLLHPAIGMVGFDTADEVDLATLLDCAPPRPTNWDRAQPGPAPRPRLQRVRILPPTAAEVVESIQEEVGTLPLARLPGLAQDRPGPGREALDTLWRRMLKAGLAVVRGLPRWPAGGVLRVVGGLLLVVVSLWGLLLILRQLGSSAGGMGLVVPITMLVMQLLRHLRRPAAGPPAAAGAPGGGPPPRGPGRRPVGHQPARGACSGGWSNGWGAASTNWSRSARASLSGCCGCSATTRPRP